tara:strand:- start:598 stop:1074 length:477 start_codon:yes stop_codon:yes gene_type:complete
LKIIDNFLPQNIFDELQKNVMGDNFPWHFQSDIEKEDSEDDKFYFTHILYDDEKQNSPYFNKFTSILDILKPKNLIRMKLNLYTRTEKLEEHLPHTDYNFNNNGCVLSLNTCDGFTRLEKEVVNSVANRAVIFDAQKPHNSTSTTNAKARFNININYN